MSDKIGQIYIVDGLIQFEPGIRRITNLKNNKEIILHLTCARCLHLLLENSGTIVTQKELLIYAWPDSYDDVTHNTFYQSVLNLRKAFVHIDYHQQTILTIRGKGLKTPSSINIEKVDSSLIRQNAFTSLPMEDEPTPVYSIDSVDVDGSSDLVTSKLHRKKNIMLLGGVLSIILLASVIFFISIKKDFFHSYALGHIASNGCSIFVNKSSPNVKTHDYFIQNEVSHVCGNNEFVYLTAYKNTASVSAFVCNKKLGSIFMSNCISRYYPDIGVGNEI